MKIVLTLLFILTSLLAEKFQMPSKEFTCSGAVTDMVVQKKTLYVATDAGAVDVFDIKSTKLLYSIKIDKITDFMGDEIDSKIYSVDVLDKSVLILSQAPKGFRQLHVYEAGQLEMIISNKEMLYIGQAKFLDKETLLLGTLGNEIISYDKKEKSKNWIHQISQSKFSNFSLNEDKTQIVIADESGDLKIHNTKDGSFIKILKDQNLDNVFQVDFKNSIIATAGQDRRVVVYDLKSNSAYYKTASFLIYGVGLSPSAARVAYSSDEQNNVTVFNTATQHIIGTFGGIKMTLSKILFLNENEFLVSSDDITVNLYKIK